MKRTRTLALVLLAALALGAFIGGPRAEAFGGPLVVGVRDDIVNFSFFNETTGKYYGLEIDIATELAKRLGRDGVEFVTVTPTTREQMLTDGEVDCLVACYSITDERKELFDFSPAYYHDGTVLMVQTSSLFTQRTDLVGMTVGVLNGSNTEELVRDVMTAIDEKGVKLWDADTYQELSNALETGVVDAVCMDGCIAQAYMNGDRSYLPGSLAEQFYGVATQKDSALSGQVADAMEKLQDDGTLDTLVEKWS